MITTDLGSVTAYAEAVAQGYTGTKEEFGKLLANYMQTAEKVAEDKAAAEQAMESAKESADRASTSEQNAKDSEDAVVQKLAEAKTEVDASVEAGKKSKTDLDKSIADSAKAKTALDESIKSANGSKSALDKTVEQANVLDASLSSNIVDGTQLNKAITASGRKAVSDINSASTQALSDINTTGAEKLDAVNKAAEAIAADREQIAKNKTDIASLNEDISTKITKFYASSQGETRLSDSDNGKIMDMMLFGKSEQAVTTGAQLLGSDTTFVRNTNDVNITINNPYEVSWTHNTNAPIRGVYLNNAKPILANKQYIISFDARFSDNNSHNMRCVDTNKTCVNGRNSVLINIHEKDSTVSFYVLNNISEGLSVTISNIMLEEGSTAHDFEPYTGGQPSPSSNYPQKIKNVVNPTVKVCGKNLSREEIHRINIDKSRPYLYDVKVTSPVSVAAWAGIGFALKIAPNTQYTISTDTSNNDYLLVGEYKSINDITNCNNCIKHIERSVSDNITFTSSPECNAIVCCIMPKKTCNISWTYWQIELGSTPTAYEPYHEQTVTIPYTLNAIPVSSGGNVTIDDGQQYVADYVNVERGKLVKMVDSSKLDNTQSIIGKTEWLLAEPQEINLTQKEVQTLKTLAAYYPTTNISINSEQLDGYTIFNYPISMENGWNYVKQQIGDTREYIYDMNARTQDTDLQAAEAYVNSEYAVALTELEV